MCKHARVIHTASNPNGRSIKISRSADLYTVQFFIECPDGSKEYLHLSDYDTPIRGDAFHAAQSHLNKEYA